MTLEIDILEPKARKLLEDLAAMNLISIKDSRNERLRGLLEKLRSRSEEISIEEITEEVELVRAERYANREK
jgi:hypothetical protein